MPESFGRYQLQKKIAQGGMAEVFLARREGEIGGFSRQVAIKRLFPHFVDQEESINMFIDEARIASRLSHPNIVQIYDLGMESESFFIAMEYVEGVDLRRLCELGVKKKSFLPRPLAVHLIAEVAAGLHYAHTRTDDAGRPMRVVHRDVSPQNILISVDGSVKLCDFGIARAESRLSHTRAGEFKGKFAYMSPEQFGRGDLDHRSDIFTLGTVLYEITVATRLFRSRTEYETMRKITEGEIIPPRAIRPEFSPRLEEIILKALATNLEERYQTAAALHEDLEEWLFEERHRVGSRQLAAYLASVFESAEVEEPWEEQEEQEEEVKEDTTMEISMSDGELLELSESPDPDAQPDAMGDTTVEDATFPFDELEGLAQAEDDTEILHVPEGAVEIRRISPEEAQRRREGRAAMAARGVEVSVVLEEGDTEVERESALTTAPGEVDGPRPSRRITDEWRRQEEGAHGDEGEKEGGNSLELLLDGLPELKSGGRRLDPPERLEETPGKGQESPKQKEAVAVERRLAAPMDEDWITGPMRKLDPVGSTRQNSVMVLLRSSLLLQVGVVAGVAALVVFTGVLAMSFRGGENQEELLPLPEMEHGSMMGEMVSLRVESDPPDARVIVNGLRVDGLTPLSVLVPRGEESEVWISRARYRPVKMLVEGGTADHRSVELERATSTETARVEFFSEPSGATVYLDGEQLGQTPLRMENVSADFESHVQFQLEGHRPFVALVHFGSRESYQVRGSLVREGHPVVVGRFEMEPHGSRVLREGELLATTPFEREFVRGEWLALEVEGHDREARQVRLRLDEVGSFLLATELGRLRRERGRMTLEVEPNAAIYIDARSYGAGPLAGLELPEGEHTVVLETLEGHRLRVPLEIEAGSHRHYLVSIQGQEALVERR